MTLFSEQPRPSRPSYSFIASILLHGTALGLISLGILCAPRVSPAAPAARYAMRYLDLHTLSPQMRQSAGSAIEYPRWHSGSQQLPSGGGPSVTPPVLRPLALAAHGAQTLLQPDIPKPLTLAVKIQAPTVVIWNARNAPAKTIVAPMPEKPPSADLRPSMQLPNDEQRLSEISLKAINLAAQQHPIQAGTATPVLAQDKKPSPPAPVTTTQGAAQPTSAAVISLSDLRMKDGAFTLPPVNEIASSNSPGELATEQAKESSQAGHGNPASQSGAPAAAGKTGKAGASKGADKAAGGAVDPSESAASSTASGRGASWLGSQPAATHITLPKNGQFGAVVVGSSMAEEYPETAGLWSGRMAYTVYLHVGQAKSWILQYSLPRAAEAAEAGAMARIAAPWPYNIVTPNLAPEAIDTGALILHGFVNQAGRFEDLAIAFPPHFAQARFVLDSLAQWQFRPAAQNGQKIKVEVVLIIPEQE
jgi:hypothetical protein